MSRASLIRAIVIVGLMSVLLVSSPSMASNPRAVKGPEGNSLDSIPTVSIENAYLKVYSSSGGRFVNGTTGGDPNTTADDYKRLLYGYPGDVGSGFSTLRINDGITTSDYRLGVTDWVSGIAPIAPPTSDGTKITSIYEQSGVRVVERLYFVQNTATGRPDTTAIEYAITNNNTSSRSIGLRIMMDVMVGLNDGAPYFILGTGQVTQQAEWIGVNVPDYWIAYESATFDPASLKGRGQLSGDNAIRPDRFVIADWPQAYATVWDYSVIPSDPVTNDSAVILYFNPLTVEAGQTRTVRTNYGIAPAGDVAQLELTGLEVTQAIQNLEDSVVLIQDRPTYVRAHVRSTSGTVNDVTAELIGRRDGNPLAGSPLQLANTGGNIDILENPNRSQLNDSFYFELPAAWRSGTIELEFHGVNRTIACADHAGTDNDCKVQVTFTDSPAADVRFVGIVWKDGDVRHVPTWGDIEAVAQEIDSTFPIPSLTWDYQYDIEPVFFAVQPDDVLDFLRMISMLSISRTLDGCISSWPVNCTRYYLGILVDPPASGVMGASFVPSDVAVAYYTFPTDGFFTPAHEFGHSAGREHTYCNGDEDDPDPDYPYSDGHISEDTTGDNAFFGFDINTMRIYGPGTGDLISYCTPNWPSDWTYTHIRDQFVSRYGTMATNALTLIEGEPAVLVSGTVTPALDTGELGSVINIDSPVSITAPVPGSYTIRFENNTGQILASYDFEPQYVVESRTGAADNEDEIGTFALLLPRNLETARIVLLQNSQVLDTRLASLNPPSVEVTFPNGGETLSGSSAVVTWTASDLDANPLTYVVQYSTDNGSTWETLVSEWTITSYELNLDVLPGTNQGLIRVLASDGFLTAQDQSNGTFVVGKHAPLPTIQSPETNALYVGEQTIILEGSAYDVEDGQLGDSALSWTSNLNGSLGSGLSLAINALALTEGTHTITLTALDSDGQSGTTSISIQVYRTRPLLPASLSITPSAITYTALVNGVQTEWQTLSIRNSGDGTLTWSVVADSSWIRISSMGGITPVDILLAADPGGLPVGVYSGTVTITAAGADNSPQVIQVTLIVRQVYRILLPVALRTQ